MKLGPWCAGLALAAALLPAAAQGPVTLADAVESAWRRSAQSAEVAGQARRAQAGRTGAAALWAAPPAVELGVMRDRQRAQGSVRETEVGVALPLWLPGQRVARLAQADADTSLAALAAAAARLRVAGAVREAAAEVGLQRAALASAEAEHEALDALARDVERRVAAGDLARSDALAARAERLAAAAALTQARQGLQAAQVHWQALTGLAQVPELTPAVQATPATAPAAQAAPPAESAHPALRAAASKVESARQHLAVVRASRREAPELLVRARQEEAPGEPHTRGAGVALRIPLGTADRNEPLLAAALAELEMAEAAERELRQQIEAGLAAARGAEAAARQQLADETARSQLLRERAGLIEKSYKAGETALPEMLRALTAAAAAEAAAARARAALAQAASRLEQALGVMP